MKYYYVLGSGQPNDRAIYFTGKYSFHGSEHWGNIEEAHLFTDMTELCEHLIRHPEIRCFIVEIADVTVERIRAAAAGNAEYKDLRDKFNTVSYVMNSRC